jgi:hypothetical protein
MTKKIAGMTPKIPVASATQNECTTGRPSRLHDHPRVALPYSSARTICPTKLFPFGLNQTIV